MRPPARSIAHLDLDCFFVSVERIRDASLEGKPVIVGGSPSGRGVVSSASYEARAFGVRSAMPTVRALRLCPSLILVSSHFADYEEYSDRLYRRMLDFAPVIERASIDEMYMDFTGCESLYSNDLPGLMRSLQRLTWEELHLPSTIALASSKVVAKIAAATVKPAGFCHVPDGTEAEFLAPLPVGALPGVGKKVEEILVQKGFRTIRDIQRSRPEELLRLLGRNGRWLYDAAAGRDSGSVSPDRTRKSISKERTFREDITERGKLEKILFSLAEDVCCSLRSEGLKAGTITLKLRYADFRTLTRETSVDATHDDTVVFRTVRDLFRRAYDRPLAVRLLGVGVSRFSEAREAELPLFPTDARREQMLDAVNALRGRFGDDVIHVGGA